MEIPEEAPDSDSSLKPNPSSETTQTQNKGQTGGGGARQGGVPEMHPLPLKPQAMEVPCTKIQTQPVRNHKVREPSLLGFRLLNQMMKILERK